MTEDIRLTMLGEEQATVMKVGFNTEEGRMTILIDARPDPKNPEDTIINVFVGGGPAPSVEGVVTVGGVLTGIGEFIQSPEYKALTKKAIEDALEEQAKKEAEARAREAVRPLDFVEDDDRPGT